MYTIPDFNINTQGTDITHALKMTRDAIGLMGINMEDEGEAILAASALESIEPAYENSLITLVDVDFTAYRRANEKRTARKNCTIPSWLNVEAEKTGLNVSALLQAAIKKELQIDG